MRQSEDRGRLPVGEALGAIAKGRSHCSAGIYLCDN